MRRWRRDRGLGSCWQYSAAGRARHGAMLRPRPKRCGLHFGRSRNVRADLRPFSRQHDKEKIMPTVDLYLPPKAYSAWCRKEAIHPVAAAVALIARWLETARQR